MIVTAVAQALRRSYAVTMVTSFVVLSCLFVAVGVLERVPAFQFRRTPGLWRPFMATDGAWYLVATGANVISAFVFRPQLVKLAMPGVREIVAGWPSGVRLVVALVVYDLVAFAVHVVI